MPIEFRCRQCQRLLRTPDNSGGKQTKCPQCGTILDIPLPGASAPPVTPSAPVSDAVPPLQAAPRASGATMATSPFTVQSNPYAASTVSPLAGQQGSLPESRLIEVGDVLSRTWNIYTDNLGQLILGVLLLYVIFFVMAIPIALLIGIGVSVGAAIGNQGNDAAGAITVLLSIFLAVVLIVALSAWIYAGLAVWLLKMARGEDAGLGNMFRGGPYFGRFIVAGLLSTLAILPGYVLCFLPGLFIATMLSQFPWLIVDRNAGSMDSLRGSMRLTGGNRLNLFLLVLIMMAVGIISAFIPFGALFSAPYMWLMFAVAYLRMSGQATADMPATQPA